MEGTFKPPFILYKDKYRLPMLTTVEYIEEFQDMEVRNDDVFIVTYPKSGTHWMQELIHLIYAGGDTSKVSSSQRMIVAEMADVARLKMVPEKDPNFRLQKDAPSPRVFTTHVQCVMLPQQIWRKQCKVIYLYRHPKDVICSFYNFHLKLYKRFGGADVLDTPEQFDTFFHAVLDGDIEYGSWFDHVLEYYPHRDKDFFLFISYEDMKQDITSVIERVSTFLDRHVDGDTIKRIIEGTSFSTMKEAFEEDHRKHLAEGSGKMHLDVFLNEGTTDQWKTRFTTAQNAEFDEIFSRRMKDCELTKSYASTESKL